MEIFCFYATLALTVVVSAAIQASIKHALDADLFTLNIKLI